MPKIVGVAEIHLLLVPRVTKQRVWQLTQRPDFPQPVYELSAGKFWLLEDVVAWAKATGRQYDLSLTV